MYFFDECPHGIAGGLIRMILWVWPKLFNPKLNRITQQMTCEYLIDKAKNQLILFVPKP